MHFYVIYYDNGAEYEDEDCRAIGIYTDYDKAVKDIEKRGYVCDKNDKNAFIKPDGMRTKEIEIVEVEKNVIFNDQFV